MWTTEALISYQKDNKEATQKVTSPRCRNTLLLNIILSVMLTFRLFLKKYVLLFILSLYHILLPVPRTHLKFSDTELLFLGEWAVCQGIGESKQAPEQLTMSCMSGLQYCAARKKLQWHKKSQSNLQPCGRRAWMWCSNKTSMYRLTT